MHLLVRQFDNDRAVHDVVHRRHSGMDCVLQHDDDHHDDGADHCDNHRGAKRAAAFAVLPRTDSHAVGHHTVFANSAMLVPVLQCDALCQLLNDVPTTVECRVR